MDALLREHRILAQVQGHPNIVVSYGLLGLQPPLPELSKVALVLKLYQGTLDSISPMEERPARGLLRELLSALRWLHQQSIVHRDVRGANVLIDEWGRSALADFGSACPLADEEQLKQRVSCVGYAAPELASAQSYCEKVDVYSAGCTMLTMLCGTGVLGGSLLEVVMRKPNLDRLEVRNVRGFLSGLLCPEALFRPSAAEALASLEREF